MLGRGSAPLQSGSRRLAGPHATRSGAQASSVGVAGRSGDRTRVAVMSEGIDMPDAHEDGMDEVETKGPGKTGVRSARG